MNITLRHTYSKNDKEDHLKIVEKILPELPIYIFIALSFVLLIVSGMRYYLVPGRESRIFLIVIAAFILLAILMLTYTKKQKPLLAGYTENALGMQQIITFTNEGIGISLDGSPQKSYGWKDVLGHYITNKYYALYIHSKPNSLVVIRIDEDNIKDLNTISSYFSRRGIKAKELKIK